METRPIRVGQNAFRHIGVLRLAAKKRDLFSDEYTALPCVCKKCAEKMWF
jgi:hypothetical protein